MRDAADRWAFETDRLGVGPWHTIAASLDLDLSRVVAEMLTDRTTAALPESWRGEQSAHSASGWINDRDAEASMLLVVESESKQPAGILVLAEVPLPRTGVDLRIGYLFAERMWGRGLATELLSGLIDWARMQPRIRTLTGGVDPANGASVRVLEKCGFRLIDDTDDGAALYQMAVTPKSGLDCDARSSDDDRAARGSNATD